MFGQSVGLGGKTTKEANGDQIGVAVVWRLFHLLMDDADFMFWGCQGGQVNAGDGRDEVLFVTPFIALYVGDNDVNLHNSHASLMRFSAMAAGKALPS
jgi:hypothetical protein